MARFLHVVTVALLLHGQVGAQSLSAGAAHGSVGGVGSMSVELDQPAAPLLPPDPSGLLHRYEAWLETGRANGSTVSSLEDRGTAGADLTSAGSGSEVIYQDPCESSHIGHRPCFVFQDAKYLQSSQFTAVSGTITVAMVVDVDNIADTGVWLGLGSSGDTSPWIYNATSIRRIFQGGATKNISPTVVQDDYDLVCWQFTVGAGGGAGSVSVNLGADVSYTGSGTDTVTGVTIGAAENGTSPLNGSIASVLIWGPSSTVRCDQAEEYLTRVYGGMPNGEADNLTASGKDGCADAMADVDDRLCPKVGICRIAVIGDSTTVTPSDGDDWPEQLKADLVAAHPGCFEVDNYGQSGARVSDCITNWTNSVSGNGYDVVINECGLNNVMADSEDGAATAAAVKSGIHDAHRGDTSSTLGGRILSIGVPPFKLYTTSPWSSDKQAELDELNATLSSDQSVLYSQYYEYLEDVDGSDECPDTTGTSAEDWCYDGVHYTGPNSATNPGTGSTRVKDWVIQHFDGSTPP